MNRLPWFGPFLASVCLLGAFAGPVIAQQSYFDQRPLLYSTNATRGVNWAPQPPQTIPNPGGTATPGQFRGGIVYGGVTKQGATNGTLVAGGFAANVEIIKWPRSLNGSQVVSILRAAVGAPYLSHGFDFLFGEEITVPLTDLSGVKLDPSQTNYWHPEPVFIKTVLTTNLSVITLLIIESTPDSSSSRPCHCRFWTNRFPHPPLESCRRASTWKSAGRVSKL